MYDDDVSEVLIRNSLLNGRKLGFENKCIDEGYLEVAEETHFIKVIYFEFFVNSPA